MDDIIEFAATVCGMKPLDYQKAFLRALYEHEETYKPLPTIKRGNSTIGLLGAEMCGFYHDEFIIESEDE